MKTLHIQLFLFLERWVCYLLLAHDGRSSNVTEHKLVYPMHSETKQTEILVFGAEKNLLQG